MEGSVLLVRGAVFACWGLPRRNLQQGAIVSGRERGREMAVGAA